MASPLFAGAGAGAGGGGLGGIGTVATALTLDKLIDLIPQLFKDQAPKGGTGTQGYASPQLDVNQMLNQINQINFNKAKLRAIGRADLAGEDLNVEEIANFFSQLSAQRLAEAGVRERALASVQGQYAALPSMYNAVGTGLQAMGGNIDTAIDKILGRRTIGGEGSATEVARGF